MTEHALLVDDDADFAKLTLLRLKRFLPNYSFTHVGSLAAARELLSSVLQQQHFSLVVLDQHLPDGRGLQLLEEGYFAGTAVLAVSSDDAPEMPGATIKAGASYFLSKSDTSTALFKPLVEGIIERNKLARELHELKLRAAILDTVKTLVLTLRHEINNPLGAVLGAAYLLRNSPSASPEQKEAAELVEGSGQRIKHVLEQLCSTVEMKAVTKAHQTVFQIPGDAPWEDKKS
jgi:signal transduction histidine kinase